MLYLQPQNWFYHNGNINCIGYTPQGQTICVKICSKSTYLLKFPIIPDTNMLTTLRDFFSSSSIQLTDDPHIILIRASSNINIQHCKSLCEILVDPAGPISSLLRYNNIQPYNWLQIEKFIPIPGNYSNCDINVITEDIEISSCDKSMSDIPSKTVSIKFNNNKVYIYNNDVRKKYQISYDGIKNLLMDLNTSWTIRKPDRIISSDHDWLFLQNLFHQYDINIPSKISSTNYGYHVVDYYDKILYNELSITECIADQVIFNIDPCLCFNKKRPKSDIDLCVRSGIYKNVYVYDYTKMYIKILLKEPHQSFKILAHRLKYAPSNLIAISYGFLFSYDNVRDYLLQQNFIHDIIDIDTTTIRLKSCPNLPSELRLCDKFDRYINMGICGNISIDSNYNVTCSGTHYLCRPKFPLIIKHLLSFFYPDYVPIETLSDYILTSEVNNLLFTNSGSIQQQLGIQYEKNIICSLSLQYYMTKNHPILLCKNNSIQLHNLDKDYYKQELTNYMTKLNNCKIHY